MILIQSTELNKCILSYKKVKTSNLETIKKTNRFVMTLWPATFWLMKLYWTSLHLKFLSTPLTLVFRYVYKSRNTLQYVSQWHNNKVWKFVRIIKLPFSILNFEKYYQLWKKFHNSKLTCIHFKTINNAISHDHIAFYIFLYGGLTPLSV